MQTSIFDDFLNSNIYGILGIVALLAMISSIIIIAWRNASESRYERACRKTEEAYERYVLNHRDESRD